MLVRLRLNVLSSTPARADRRAPRTDGPLTHFRSPRDEKPGLDATRPQASFPPGSSTTGAPVNSEANTDSQALPPILAKPFGHDVLTGPGSREQEDESERNRTTAGNLGVLKTQVYRRRSDRLHKG